MFLWFCYVKRRGGPGENELESADSGIAGAWTCGGQGGGQGVHVYPWQVSRVSMGEKVVSRCSLTMQSQYMMVIF